MPYITTTELAERVGLRELTQLGSAEHQAVTDYALMDATLRAQARGAWSAEQCAAADLALARIQDTIAEADAIIDGYLLQRGYTLPLALGPASTGQRVVAAWSRAITRYLLNRSRITDEAKDPVARDYRDALKTLGLLAAGKFSLAAELPQAADAPAGEGGLCLTGAAPVFGRTQLHAFR